MKLLLYVLAAALCTGTGLMVPTLWPLTLLGIALYLYIQWTHTARPSQAFANSILFTVTVSGFSVWWFTDAHPLDWLSLGNDSVPLAVLTITLLVTTLALSIGPSVVGLALWFVRANTYRILLAGFIFVLADELRMWGFALLTYSPDSLFGPHFSVGSIGYALSESPHLLQLASYGGVHILTFFAVLIAGSIAVIAARVRGRIEWLVVSMVIISCTVIPVVSIQTTVSMGDREPLDVVLVHTSEPIGSLPPTEKRTKELLHAALALRPDVVVFPEQYRASAAVADLPAADKKSESIVISADHTPVGNGDYTVDLVYDSTTRGRIAVHHKTFLMALGEYSPLAASPLYAPLANERINSYLASVRAVKPQGTETTIVPYASWKLGGLLCSETLSPHLYKRLARSGATVLINSANPSWFRSSPMLHKKLLQIARVHAVENRAYFLQASNELPSYALSPLGDMIAKSSEDTELVSITIR